MLFLHMFGLAQVNLGVRILKLSRLAQILFQKLKFSTKLDLHPKSFLTFLIFPIPILFNDPATFKTRSQLTEKRSKPPQNLNIVQST